MFEKASRLKLRFKSENGVLTVEDLWDLSAVKLDAMYKAYNKLTKAREEGGLLTTKTKEDTTLSLQLDLIKYVFGVKEAEADAAKTKATLKLQEQKLLGLIADAEDADLRSKSPEELKKMLEELQG